MIEYSEKHANSEKLNNEKNISNEKNIHEKAIDEKGNYDQDNEMITNLTETSISSDDISDEIEKPQSSNELSSIHTSEPVSSENIKINMNDSVTEDLKNAFEKIDCKDENYYSNDCNKFLLKKELIEREYLSEHPDDTPFLYLQLI